MSEQVLYAIPSRNELAEAAADGFVLWIGADQALPLTLLQLLDGTPMSARYECFSVVFALPPAVSLPQAVYRLGGPAGQEWVLLMTPVMPEADGRHTLEAVIHRECQSSPQAVCG
ncbi:MULTISPECIES: hypothetical protein [Pseudomonas]|nr:MULTISPECIES: hypothetical protein [Pseudomonas]MBF4209685.1 hypothetical protein [Pseudomonas donghuensis]MBS7601184.1 hypothetical protein [Pseudomonas sp. RC2C2]MCP6697967.1 hypothetical protein [Pseudomonas donghuensis]PJY93900.1 hypothetical protein COO64_23450 [Pseudomonas donghuensis]UVL26964.1 hypothetical protein LOY30_13600 [Pseudomonas donghuensis]